MSRGFLIYIYVPRPYINARTQQGFMATIFRQYALAKKKYMRVFSWQCQHRQWRASYYNVYYCIKDILFDFLKSWNQHKLHSSNLDYKIMKLTCTFRCSIIPCSSGIIRPHFFFSTSKEYLTNLYTRRYITDKL